MQVAQRLALVGRRHARHAADQAWRGRPIGPHALVFLYQQPAAGRSGDGLFIASRLFLAGADVVDLAVILTQVHACATDYATGPRFDPRAQLSTHAEPMPRAVHYVGVGASTLASGPGANAVGREYDTPFRALALLADETQLVVRGAGMTEPLDIRSTHTLESTQHATGRQRWAWMHAGAEAAEDRRLPEVWSRLHALHDLILDTTVSLFQ